MIPITDYPHYDALGLAALVRDGEVTPAELLDTAIAQVERLNPRLNAVIETMYDRARAAVSAGLPAGPFTGVPFLLKDINIYYAGVPTRAGSRFLRDFVPARDSELVRRYKQAGLVIFGKTNTPELGLTPFTEPELFGATPTPWDLSRTAGGSSGGAAAAVAAGIVPAAHGSDGGGSIRIPAACCGLFGLKPTRGRTPLGPYVGEGWQGLVCEHALTRSVRDSAALLDATAGPDVGAPYYPPPPPRPFLDEVGADPGRLRIAFTAQPFLGGTVHADCLAALNSTTKLLKGLGHDVIAAAPEIDSAAFRRDFFTLIAGETRAGIAAWEALLGRRATHADFETATWVVALLGEQIAAAEFAAAGHRLKLAARRIGEFFEVYDVLLSPTLAEPPVKTGSLQPRGLDALAGEVLAPLNAGRVLRALGAIDAAVGDIMDFAAYPPPFNVTGQPAMSVPLHWNADGLPIGVQFVGRYADEATLFRLAGQLEKARPWFHRMPDANC
jgi:amidase